MNSNPRCGLSHPDLNGVALTPIALQVQLFFQQPFVQEPLYFA
jgi:hypothetical protein